MRLRSLLSAALLLLAPSYALNLQGVVLSSPVLANLSSLSPSSKVVLDHGARSAFICADGKFEIPDVSDGQHVLTPHIPGFIAASILITITPETNHVQTYFPHRKALPTTSPSQPYPIRLQIVGKEDYYLSPPGLNILGLLKNPMVIMMLFSAVMLFAVPKLLANIDIDPETARDMAAAREKMRGMQSSDLVGSLSTMLAGGEGPAATGGTTQVAPSSSASGSSTPAKSGGGSAGKRRKGR